MSCEKRNLLLPGNQRYQPNQLRDVFGYDNLYREVAAVEIATLETLGEIGIIPESEIAELMPSIITTILSIPTTEVDRIEREITKHDVRAWVRKAQEIVGGKAKRWIHVPLTSYDPLDTARTLQFLKAYREAIRPTLAEAVLELVNLTRRFSGQIQIGRTHGQHALPITIGFWLATILSRIIFNWKQMDLFSQGLLGKISGAVGAYNAQCGLRINERALALKKRRFEDLVLDKLGLKAARISTQILPPESLGYFLFSSSMLSATLGQLGRDCRNLMRSEIAEVEEAFEVGQVGSSTMAHKRNPINFENLEGMWIRTKNEFGKVLDTLISEHQRDLVGSCVARDFPIILVNLQQQINTLLRKNSDGIPFLRRISINREICERNFRHSANVILAEPIYLALQMAGYPGDAHELVNHKLVPIAVSLQRPLIHVLRQVAVDNEALAETLKRIPDDIIELLRHPERYIGDAEVKALEIAKEAKETVKSLLAK